MKSRVWMSLGPNDVRQVSEYTAAEKVIIIIRSVLLRGGRQIVIATSNWNVPRGSTITHNDSRAEILLSLKPRKGRGLIKYAYTPWSWYIGKSEKRNSYIIGWRLFPPGCKCISSQKKVKEKKASYLLIHTNATRTLTPVEDIGTIGCSLSFCLTVTDCQSSLSLHYFGPNMLQLCNWTSVQP